MAERAPVQYQQPRLLSVASAAVALGIGRTLLRQLLKERRIAAVKLERRTLVPLDGIERVIAAARVAGGDQ